MKARDLQKQHQRLVIHPGNPIKNPGEKTEAQHVVEHKDDCISCMFASSCSLLTQGDANIRITGCSQFVRKPDEIREFDEILEAMK